MSAGATNVLRRSTHLIRKSMISTRVVARDTGGDRPGPDTSESRPSEIHRESHDLKERTSLAAQKETKACENDAYCERSHA
jgi:hypothetical protein